VSYCIRALGESNCAAVGPSSVSKPPKTHTHIHTQVGGTRNYTLFRAVISATMTFTFATVVHS
jgi:hypothetical protein